MSLVQRIQRERIFLRNESASYFTLLICNYTFTFKTNLDKNQVFLRIINHKLTSNFLIPHREPINRNNRKNISIFQIYWIHFARGSPLDRNYGRREFVHGVQSPFQRNQQTWRGHKSTVLQSKKRRRRRRKNVKTLSSQLHRFCFKTHQLEIDSLENHPYSYVREVEDRTKSKSVIIIHLVQNK